MKIKFILRFKGGDRVWWHNGCFHKFKTEHILQCLFSFTEVHEFYSCFSQKERQWVTQITIPPITASSFETKFGEALKKLIKNLDLVVIEVTEMKLSKKDMEGYTTARLMEKIEGEPK